MFHVIEDINLDGEIDDYPTNLVDEDGYIIMNNCDVDEINKLVKEHNLPFTVYGELGDTGVLMYPTSENVFMDVICSVVDDEDTGEWIYIEGGVMCIRESNFYLEIYISPTHQTSLRVMTYEETLSLPTD